MGMEVHPFDRLARAVDELQASGVVGDDFLVQLGACSYEPRHARFERYMSFGALCEHVRASAVVITHAGAGSTLVCIQQGKHPIMVPRRSGLGEHVDEHQVPFARKLSEGGLATTVEDLADLPAVISATRGKSARSDAMGRAAELSTWLEGFWSALPPRRAG
jgi:UDP-N-acetylglucosamine transferase subunit ALG13